MNAWDDYVDVDKRWVCAQCGRAAAPGAPRSVLRDTSCVMHAVLCWAAQRDDGKWNVVDRFSEGDA